MSASDPGEPSPESAGESEPKDSLLAEAAHHPIATTLLGVCIVAGAVLSALYLPEDIALLRRVVGGGLLGGLSWLLIMVGRVVGG